MQKPIKSQVALAARLTPALLLTAPAVTVMPNTLLLSFLGKELSRPAAHCTHTVSRGYGSHPSGQQSWPQTSACSQFLSQEPGTALDRPQAQESLGCWGFFVGPNTRPHSLKNLPNSRVGRQTGHCPRCSHSDSCPITLIILRYHTRRTGNLSWQTRYRTRWINEKSGDIKGSAAQRMNRSKGAEEK